MPRSVCLRQLLSLSDVPQPLSLLRPTSCSRLAPSHPADPAPSAQSDTGLASAAWRVLRVCDWPQAQPSQQLATQPQAQVCMKQALPIQQPAQASAARIPAARASNPPCRRISGMPGTRPAPSSQLTAACQGQASGQNVSETGLKLCQLLSLSDVPQPRSQLPKQLSPGWPGRDSCSRQPLRRSLKLISKYASLRLASGPVSATGLRPSQQLATQPQAQVCMKQALPIQQPAQTAQPSRSPSSRRNQQRSPAARQPATHLWLRSLVAETSFRPSPTSNPPQPARRI